MCLVPLGNSGVGLLTTVILFFFFMQHSLEYLDEKAKFRLSQQQTLKYVGLVTLNLLSMSLEVPYMLESCWVLDKTDKVDQAKTYADTIHQVNQGIARVFLNLFYIEESIFQVFNEEYFLTGYFASSLVWSVLQYILFIL